MPRTKIVCTIGPASRSSDMLRELIVAGMDVARLNMSHGDWAEHGENISRIRAVSGNVGKPVAILLDLQGPKLRVGAMQKGGVELIEGHEVVLTTRDVVGHEGVVPVQYAQLPKHVVPGEHILMDDGLLELEVSRVEGPDIHCRVITGGILRSHKGMNLPRASFSIPAITEKDRRDLLFALDHQVDWIGLSFVRTADEVLALKKLIEQHTNFGQPTPVVAKIEKPEAVDNIDAIIEAADAIMVARGDLGIETSPEEVPLMQKMIIAKCNSAGKPVITATQMLDSMMRNPRPTRAEASDVANAIFDGTDALMLSGETAVGKYPLESLQTMVRIVEYAEAHMPRLSPTKRVEVQRPSSVAEGVSHATCQTAQELDAAAIITPTMSGYTARMVSKYRPRVPIVAVTPNPAVQRRLMLHWGVCPLLVERADSTDAMIARAVEAARLHDFVKPGDIVVITGGTAGSPPGTTDLMKVQVIERILARGLGIGERGARGRIRVIRRPSEVSAINADDIIVAKKTDSSFTPLVRQATGLITEEGGATSHAAILAAELGIPAIIGVENALTIFYDGQLVTLDTRQGAVYEGQAHLP